MSGSQKTLQAALATVSFPHGKLGQSGGGVCVCGGGVIFFTIYFARKSTLAGPSVGYAGKWFLAIFTYFETALPLS